MDKKILNLMGRKNQLFIEDIKEYENQLKKIVSNSSFLVIGGAGSIGQAVTKEIFKRKPKLLYVVDINENNLTELVRDIRSSLGYIEGEFKTFALDVGSVQYDSFINAYNKFNYVLNLSALKHVRSEEDPFTLMRMIDVNILNTDKTINQSIKSGVKKYFCVSTDKATNPVNMMGASKYIMEMFLMKRSADIDVSTARFANVAFSDGSLLYGFNNRIKKKQPIAVPGDIKRYFLTSKESGELCIMSCIFGENRDIFFPKFDKTKHLVSLLDIAIKFLREKGYQAHICNTEDEARYLIKILPNQGKWPCLITKSDTTGEKEVEEFFTNKEKLNMEKYKNLGIIKNDKTYDVNSLNEFKKNIEKLKSSNWSKKSLIDEFFKLIPEFKYQDKNKYLDGKM
jgi:UDP-N-acetylglucosamine 4,6-dehydratase